MSLPFPPTPTGVASAPFVAVERDLSRAEPLWRDFERANPGRLFQRRDWVANANDSYWLPNPKQRLEGFARIIGCEKCERTLRTRMVYRYLLDRPRQGDSAKGQVLLKLRRTSYRKAQHAEVVVTAAHEFLARGQRAVGGPA